MIVLRAFWSSLGLLLGALGGLLGDLLGLQIDPKGQLLPLPFPWRTVVVGSNTGKAFWELILSLFVVLVALLLASCCSSFFEVVVDPLLEPLRVDFELPR